MAMPPGLVRGLLLVAAALHIFAQAPGDTTGAKCVLEGTAVDFATGEPVRKATVRLTPEKSKAPGQLATTDESGRFQFQEIPPGEYELTGERTGYVKGEFGASKAGDAGAPLRLYAGDKLSGLTLKLARCSIVTGKVSDENGDPIAKVLVSAVRRSWLRGQPFYSSLPGAYTDDTGSYRISDLPPGRYYLSADASSDRFVEKQGGQEKQILWSFYPGSRSLDGAEALDVQSGQDVAGIDFKLAPEPVFHIRGKLTEEIDNFALSVHFHKLGNGIAGELENGLKPDGTFDFAGAPAGTYDVELVSDDHMQTIARTSVEVKKSDVNRLVIPVPKKLRVKGIVHRPDSDTPARLTVFARDLDSPAMSFPYGVVTGLDGQFEIDDLWPGRYVFNIDDKAPGEYVKSVQYRGQETLGAGAELSGGTGEVEIILARGAARVEGSVRAEEGTFVGGLDVVLAPRVNGRLLLGKTDQNGRVSFEDVAPGAYDVFAVANMDTGLLENRDFISQLQGDGTEIEIPENGNLQIDIPLSRDEDVQRALGLLIAHNGHQTACALSLLIAHNGHQTACALENAGL
jgi:Carboxypeptidase regulatory-like domain